MGAFLWVELVKIRVDQRSKINSESTLGNDSWIPLMCYNLSDLVSVSLARLWFISKKHMYTFVISCKCLGKMYLSCYFLHVVWVKRHLSHYPQFIPFNKVYVHVSPSCMSGFYIKDVEAPLCTVSDLSSQRFLS